MCSRNRPRCSGIASCVAEEVPQRRLGRRPAGASPAGAGRAAADRRAARSSVPSAPWRGRWRAKSARPRRRRARRPSPRTSRAAQSQTVPAATLNSPARERRPAPRRSSRRASHASSVARAEPSDTFCTTGRHLGDPRGCDKTSSRKLRDDLVAGGADPDLLAVARARATTIRAPCRSCRSPAGPGWRGRRRGAPSPDGRRRRGRDSSGIRNGLPSPWPQRGGWRSSRSRPARHGPSASTPFAATHSPRARSAARCSVSLKMSSGTSASG